MTQKRTLCHCEERSDEAIWGFSEVSIVEGFAKNTGWISDVILTNCPHRDMFCTSDYTGAIK